MAKNRRTIVIVLIACIIVVVVVSGGLFLKDRLNKKEQMEVQISEVLPELTETVSDVSEASVPETEQTQKSISEYAYKRILTGKSIGDGEYIRYIVYTDDPEISFARVDRSIYGSDARDVLTDTVVTGWERIREAKEEAAKTEDATDPDNPLGVTLSVKNVSPDGATIVFSQTNGNVTGNLQTGYGYRILKADGNEEWIDVNDEETEWPEATVFIQKEGETEFSLYWGWLYGELPAGMYRIVKEVMDQTEDGMTEKYEVYAEFEIRDAAMSDGSVFTDRIRIDLPSGYHFGDYASEIGFEGGEYILPESYVVYGEENISPDWVYAGLLSRIGAENTGIVFANGLPVLKDTPAGIPLSDGARVEFMGQTGPRSPDDEWTVVMLKEIHDLYTHMGLIELQLAGMDITGWDLESEYYTFWFIKEGEPFYYTLSLSAKEFSEEEAAMIAESAEIVNR